MEGVIRNKDYDGRSTVGFVKVWRKRGARPWWIDAMSMQGWCDRGASASLPWGNRVCVSAYLYEGIIDKRNQ
jgi:hypothetical protein